MSDARAGSLIMLYRALTSAARPLAGALIAYRTRRGKEDPERRGERLGRSRVPRPDGPLVWANAVSVGEAVAVMPLVQRLLHDYPQLSVLITTTTVTSARVVQRQLPPGAIHQFAPFDSPAFVHRFLAHWQPDIVIFAESELWPNMLSAVRRSPARAALVNARMSQRSHARWQRAPNSIQWLLSSFDICLAQSAGDAERLSELGDRDVFATGNIKFDVPAPDADAAELAIFRAAFAARPRWAAVSTHPGEEDIVEQAHSVLTRQRPGLATLIAPRHPERGVEIANMLAGRGYDVQLRSKNPQPKREAAFYIFDTIGELGLLFRSVPAVFMGGSLVRHGGQNPIEPTKVGCAIVHGPHIGNFAEVYGALDVSGGAQTVSGAIQLAQAIGPLIDNRQKAALRANAAEAALEPYSGALDRTMRALQPLVDAALHNRERRAERPRET